MIWLAAESLITGGTGTINASGGNGGPETPRRTNTAATVPMAVCC